MPDWATRRHLLTRLLRQNPHCLSDEQIGRVATEAEGYSGSDLTNLAKDAAMGPVRDLDVEKCADSRRRPGSAGVRSINFQDFAKSLKKVRKSVAAESLKIFDEWNAEFGDTE